MTDWNLAVKIFVSGVSIVMLVMCSLQLSVGACSIIIRSFGNRREKAKD